MKLFFSCLLISISMAQVEIGADCSTWFDGCNECKASEVGDDLECP